MNVKEWIELLKSMPEDAEVYSYDSETGEWREASPDFIDINHKKFEDARKYNWCRVPGNKYFVGIDESQEIYNPGINLCKEEE